jgi:1-phosphatidylinositol-4-phosphate 5-kinase
MLVTRESGHDSQWTAGIHVRGSPLRASGAGDPEVDLRLPGTAR